MARLNKATALRSAASSPKLWAACRPRRYCSYAPAFAVSGRVRRVRSSGSKWPVTAVATTAAISDSSVSTSLEARSMTSPAT